MDALTDVLSKLAEAKINVTALEAVGAGEGRFGAIFWVKPAMSRRRPNCLARDEEPRS